MSDLCQTVFSDCQKYRYTLWRQVRFHDLFDGGKEWRYVMFIGLNPSTATETEDDPTIRRCVRYARDWGYDALCMTNLFAWRSTDPKQLPFVGDPVGPENDRWLLTMAQGATMVVAAWGNNGCLAGRDREVIEMIPVLHCLKVTKEGHPSHPLYLRSELKPITFRWHEHTGTD